MPCYFFFRFRPERHLSPIVAPAAELQMASLDVVGKVFNVYYAARLMPRWGKHPSKMSITGRNRLGQRILVLLLIATCSMGSCWRVWEGLWRLLFVWFFTVLYGRAEFSFARVFKWWALFLQLCEFILLEFPYKLPAAARSQRRRSAEPLLSSAALRSTRRH